MAEFSMITLNCFGVPTTSTRRRLYTLAQEVNHRPAAVVCLQEVQAHRYRKLLTHACRHVYPYHAAETFIHAPKGGLLTLSQMPIYGNDFTLYEARGLWYTPALADWILHKGVLCTQLMLGDMRVVVLNTHLTANYRGRWGRDDMFAQQEHRQLQQLAQIVTMQPLDVLVIVAGDFNIPRGSWLYDEFLAASGLTDPLADDMQPTLRLPRGMPQRFAMPIDYALIRAPKLPNLHVSSQLRFKDKVTLIGGGDAYLSDHVGVELHLTWDDVTE